MALGFKLKFRDRGSPSAAIFCLPCKATVQMMSLASNVALVRLHLRSLCRR
jgi:hypothetical protein